MDKVMEEIALKPMTILGVPPVDFAVITIIVLALLVGVAIYVLYRRPPYRVVMSTSINHKDIGVWQLVRKTHWLDGEWEIAYESENKRDVQQKAREALFAHYRFRDFINERDGELFTASESGSSPVPVSHKNIGR